MRRLCRTIVAIVLVSSTTACGSSSGAAATVPRFLPLYPGATKSLIQPPSLGMFGVRVSENQYETHDPVERVLAWYDARRGIFVRSSPTSSSVIYRSEHGTTDATVQVTGSPFETLIVYSLADVDSPRSSEGEKR